MSKLKLMMLCVPMINHLETLFALQGEQKKSILYVQFVPLPSSGLK